MVPERHGGEIVGIEVKASATPAGGDFAGLRYLRDTLGARFKAGPLLNTGADTLPFGDRLADRLRPGRRPLDGASQLVSNGAIACAHG